MQEALSLFHTEVAPTFVFTKNDIIIDVKVAIDSHVYVSFVNLYITNYM